MTNPDTNIRQRDYSKTDGIPNERWDLAELLYVTRKQTAWGKNISIILPERVGYLHGKEAADFDLALACAKAVLAVGYKL